MADAPAHVATIAAIPRPERLMSALRLPVLQVVVAFGDAARRPEFMRRFERGFQRGGAEDRQAMATRASPP